METGFPTNRNRPEPLYLQVAAYLRERIADGTYPPASPLPGELDLSALLGVSRPTVRHALEMLKDESLVETAPGRGTFVAAVRPPAAPRGRTRNLALIGPEMRDTFLTRLVMGAEYVAARNSYHLILCNAGNQIPVEQAYLRDLWDNVHVDGFVIMPADAPEPHEVLREMQRLQAPLVFVDRYFPNCDVPAVASDNYQAGYLAARHLIGLGHRQIGFITRPNLYVSSVAQRCEGYRQALLDAGLPYDATLVFQGLLPFLREIQVLKRTSPDLSEFDRRAIQDFLARAGRPTAVIACNDLIALAVIDACRELGLRIPDDLALVGCDDDAVASLVTPAITTVRQQAYEIGAAAVSTLLALINGTPVERQALLPVELVVRQSCGAAAPLEDGPVS